MLLFIYCFFDKVINFKKEGMFVKVVKVFDMLK